MIGLLLALFSAGHAQTGKQKGFEYANLPAPTGQEWESPID